MKSYEDSAECDMIFVVGETGGGKKEFVKTLSADTTHGGKLQVSPGLEITTIGIGRKQLAVVEWPGFDKSDDSDLIIYGDILRYLCAQHFLRISLRGLIYVHKITEEEVCGTSKKFVEVLRLLCGQGAMANVALITTGWDDLTNESTGCRRERQLRKGFWRHMEGSAVRRFDGSRAMAEGMVCRLMRLDKITLPTQKRLIEESGLFNETLAGRLVLPRVRQKIQEDGMRIEELQNRLGVTPQQLSNVNSGGIQVKSDERMHLLKKEAELASRRENLTSQLDFLNSNPLETIVAGLEQMKVSRQWRSPVDLFASFLELDLSNSGNVVSPLDGIRL